MKSLALMRQFPPRRIVCLTEETVETLCRRDGDRVRVFSRNALDWTDKVPAIVAAIAALRCTSVTLDGEAVVCDSATGITDFDALRLALARREGSPAAFLFAFDLLALDGQDLRAEPWQVRSETLASLLRGSKASRIAR
jgi:bifunctional non-homologous end joining protein LigD